MNAVIQDESTETDVSSTLCLCVSVCVLFSHHHRQMYCVFATGGKEPSIFAEELHLRTIFTYTLLEYCIFYTLYFFSPTFQRQKVFRYFAPIYLFKSYGSYFAGCDFGKTYNEHIMEFYTVHKTTQQYIMF